MEKGEEAEETTHLSDENASQSPPRLEVTSVVEDEGEGKKMNIHVESPEPMPPPAPASVVGSRSPSFETVAHLSSLTPSRQSSFESRVSTKIAERIERARDNVQQLSEENAWLQYSLSRLLERRMAIMEHGETDGTDAGTHYTRLLDEYQSWSDEMVKERTNMERTVAHLREKLADRQRKAEETRQALHDVRCEVALASENSRTGVPLASATMERYKQLLTDRDSEIDKVRMVHVRLRAHLDSLEGALSRKDQLGQGLHLIDYEQLKIENQSLSEKIEERAEELATLSSRLVSSVQVLSHVREKFQFIEKGNTVMRDTLHELEAEVAEEKDTVAKIKKERDTLRSENDRIQSAGIVVRDTLLNDFEIAKTQRREMMATLESLKKTYSKLVKGSRPAESDASPVHSTLKSPVSTTTPPRSPSPPSKGTLQFDDVPVCTTTEGRGSFPKRAQLTGKSVPATVKASRCCGGDLRTETTPHTHPP